MVTPPLAKQALLTLLQAAPALTGVRVSYVQPTRESQLGATQEHLWIGNVSDRQVEWHGLGRQRMLEEFAIQFNVWVWKPGDDPLATEIRAEAIDTALQAVIRADPQLGGLLHNGIVTDTSGDSTLDPTNEPEGWLAQVPSRCVCSAVTSP